jgi:hypothetical protein
MGLVLVVVVPGSRWSDRVALGEVLDDDGLLSSRDVMPL